MRPKAPFPRFTSSNQALPFKLATIFPNSTACCGSVWKTFPIQVTEAVEGAHVCICTRAAQFLSFLPFRGAEGCRHFAPPLFSSILPIELPEHLVSAIQRESGSHNSRWLIFLDTESVIKQFNVVTAIGSLPMTV